MSWSAEAVGEAMAGAAMRARGLLRTAVDVVLPPLALDAGRRGAAVQSPGLSAEACAKLGFIEAPVCDGCGAPQAIDAGADDRCAACLDRRLAVDPEHTEGPCADA